MEGRLRGWGWLLPVIVAAVYIAFGGYAALRDRLVDFNMYYLAAAAFQRGMDVYTLTAGQLDALARSVSVLQYEPPYKYPPITAIAIMPLLSLPPRAAGFVWAACSGAAAIGSVALWNASQRCGEKTQALGWLVLLASVPVLTTLYAGQVNTWVLLTVALAVWAYRRGRPFEAGLALALGTTIKLMPGVLLAYFLLRREWRAVLGGAVGLAALTGLSMLALGPGIVLSYAGHWFLEAAPQVATAYPPNQSLTGFLARLLTANAWGPSLADLPAATLWAGRAAGAAILAAAFVLALRGGSPREPGRLEADFSLLLIALHLATSVSWLHHLALMVIPCLLLLRSRRYATLAVALALMAAQGLLWHALVGVTPLLSLATYALVLMFVVIARSDAHRAPVEARVAARGREAGA